MKILRSIVYAIFALFLILLMLVGAGLWYASTQLTQWREPVAEYLSSQIGVELQIEEIQLEWEQWLPTLVVSQVELSVAEAETKVEANAAHAVFDQLTLRLRPHSSFWRGKLFEVQLYGGQLSMPALGSGMYESSDGSERALWTDRLQTLSQHAVARWLHTVSLQDTQLNLASDITIPIETIRLDLAQPEQLQLQVAVGQLMLPQTRFDAASAQLQLQLAPDTADGVVGDADAIYFKIKSNNLWLYHEAHFRHQSELAHVEVAGRLQQDAQGLIVIDMDRLEIQDEHLHTALHGQWRELPEGGSGWLRLEGAVEHATIPYIPRFLPKAIHANALDWLDGAFVAGTLSQGQVVLEGALDHYPFGRHPESGFQHITANLHDVALDFHHQSTGKRWPVLHLPQSRFDFNNDVIRIEAERGWMNEVVASATTEPVEQGSGTSSYHTPSPEVAPLAQLQHIQAVISDLERDSQLQVTGEVQTTGRAIMALEQHSPLGELINHALAESVLDGQVNGDLQLNIPLDDMEQSTVQGRLHVQEGSFQLMPTMPVVTAIEGEMQFNEQSLFLNGLKGQLLGGATEATGYIGRADHPLILQGNLSAAALHEVYPADGLRHFAGQTAYELKVNFEPEQRYDVVFTADLKGLGIDFPGVYTKLPAHRLPLLLEWRSQPVGKAREGQLAVTLKGERQHTNSSQAVGDVAPNDSNQAQVILHFRAPSIGKVTFERGAVAFGQRPEIQGQGLYVQGRLGRVSLEALQAVLDSFAPPTQRTTSKTLLRGLDMTIGELVFQGVSFADLGVKGAIDPEGTMHFALSGPTAQGQLRLQPNGQLEGGGRGLTLYARLSHLNMHTDRQVQRLLSQLRQDAQAVEQTPTASASHSDWWLDAVDVSIEELHLYQYHMHALNFLGRTIAPHHWEISRFSLSDRGGSLAAAGHIKNHQERLQADINIEVQTDNIGDLLHELSLGEDVLTGEGQIEANLRVSDLLNFQLEHLSLNALGTFTDGYINRAASGSTRLLSLLSFQSLSRLPELSHVFASSGDDALNYRYLRFHLGIQRGEFRVPDFRLDSPILAIVAEGGGNLIDNQLAFDVVAIPRLDMSGTAVLTGVLINPAVGVATFLSQWLLRDSMEQGLTQRYRVDGRFDDIRIDGVPIKANNQTVDTSDTPPINLNQEASIKAVVPSMVGKEPLVIPIDSAKLRDVEPVTTTETTTETAPSQ